jgi:hypothetical protein
MSRKVDLKENFKEIYNVLGSNEDLLNNSDALRQIYNSMTFLGKCCKCKQREVSERIGGLFSGLPSNTDPEIKQKIRNAFDTDLVIVTYGAETICEI